MQTRGIAVVFVVGILVGAGTLEVFQIIREHRRREFFEQRLRCKKLAEEYAKSHSDNYNSVLPDRSDFSTSRNSCVASTDEYSGNARFVSYQVVDVVTGELISTASCDNHDSQSPSFCGGGRNMKLMQERDAAFDKAVK